MDWQGSASPNPIFSNEQHATTNATPSPCAPTMSVRSLSESLHAHNVGCAQPAYALRCRTLVAARGCCRSCPPARRLGGHRAASPLIGRHSPRPSHCPRARRRPHQFESWQRCRTSWVIGRPSRARASTRKSALTRRWYDAPLTRPRRLRGAPEARCAGAPYGQSAGQHSSPYGHLADSAVSATPPPKAAAPLPAHETRACTRGG